MNIICIIFNLILEKNKYALTTNKRRVFCQIAFIFLKYWLDIIMLLDGGVKLIYIDNALQLIFNIIILNYNSTNYSIRL